MRLGWKSADQVWADLRATRSNPPGWAGPEPERREVYSSALEQSEQLFRAAGVVGLASRPLLVFYGLSQAGRAVAAAARELDQDSWRLHGHGLTIRRETEPLPNVVVATQGSAQSSFRRLSTLLGSPELPVVNTPMEVPLGRLWDALPEGQDRPLRPDPERRPVMSFSRLGNAGHPYATGVVTGFPRWLAESTQAAEDFKGFMSAYPHASGYSMALSQPGREVPGFVVGDRVALVMHWDTGVRDASDSQQDARLADVMTTYAGDQYLAPAMPGAGIPSHALMAWWTVLFALSMLARYQPAEWTKHIDVDKSSFAVALEVVLTEALVSVPRIVDETIRSVSE